MSEFVIETHGLTKYFGKRCAVRSLDLRVPKGSIFGLLGTNGAGKTTTLRMLLGLQRPTRGSSTIFGVDSTRLTSELRARIGYLTESHPVYGWMTVAQFGAFQARFYPRWSDEAFKRVIAHFRLDPRAKTKDLSRGERAGLCLAATLAPDPDVLILDDPALGLDPVARRRLLESMVQLTMAEQRTVIFSSHLLADVERVCDRVAVIDRGIMRADCPLETFRDSVKRVRVVFAENAPEVPTLPGLLESKRGERDWQLTLVARNDSWRVPIDEQAPSVVEEIPIGLEDAVISYLGDSDGGSFFHDNRRDRS
jgi:ABC-2 type transport system ATP-binding protein